MTVETLGVLGGYLKSREWYIVVPWSDDPVASVAAVQRMLGTVEREGGGKGDVELLLVQLIGVLDLWPMFAVKKRAISRDALLRALHGGAEAHPETAEAVRQDLCEERDLIFIASTDSDDDFESFLETIRLTLEAALDAAA